MPNYGGLWDLQSIEEATNVFYASAAIIATDRFIRFTNTSASQTENVEAISELRSEMVIDVRGVIKARKKKNCFPRSAPINVMQLEPIGGDVLVFDLRV